MNPSFIQYHVNLTELKTQHTILHFAEAKLLRSKLSRRPIYLYKLIFNDQKNFFLMLHALTI